MPNFEKPGNDFPSREDIQREEREDRRREREWTRQCERIDAYLANHPSASWAEAEYRTNKE